MPSRHSTRSKHPVQPGGIVAVWGPGGSPGCSTVAAGIAATIARRFDGPVTLVDCDLTRGGLTHLLQTSPGRTLGSALALPHAGDEPCAPGHLQETHWNASILPGVAGPGAPVEIIPAELDNLLTRLSQRSAITVVDVGDELPLREHGDLHASVLGRADLLIAVGAATETGAHDLLLEYRLLDRVLQARNPHVERWAVINHMADKDILQWRRMLREQLHLELVSQLPHDWAATCRARTRHLPVPVVAPRCTLSKALDRLGGRAVETLSTIHRHRSPSEQDNVEERHHDQIVCK